MIDTTPISTLVKHQFPDFYKDQGPNFIAFIEAYYEWLEQDGQILHTSHRLPTYVDIDTTSDKFLSHFREQYMNELPIEIIGNQRLFQKHIQELYRSKGSITGLRLLFRLMYNTDVDVYIPSYDILRGSDGQWKIPQYLEVTNSDKLSIYDGKLITGSQSKATAVVSSVQNTVLNDRSINVIYLTNIFGTFAIGEYILIDGVEILQAPKIIGSAATIKPITSSANFKVGDVLVDQNDQQEKAYAVVQEVYDATGIIEFQIVDGGDYYSLDANVTITSGTNTSGVGADFRVFSLSNTSNFTYNTDLLTTYASKRLNANTYGFPFNPSANSSTPIESAMTFLTTLVGTIDKLSVTNPGSGYDGSVTVSVVDPHTVSRGIWAGDSWGGNNAVITGSSLTGSGLISKAAIYDSGLRYNASNTQLTMSNQANSIMTATVQYQTAALGKHPGYFDNSRGFLSSDKFLFDGEYYQDFSYEVRTSRSLEQYVDVLKKTIHSAGNIVFGAILLRSSNKDHLQEVYSSIISQ